MTEGLAANDDTGLLLRFDATTSDAANIMLNAVNAQAGYLLCQVDYPSNETNDFCWIPVITSFNWTPLTGSSPYAVARHYNEFIIEGVWSDNTNRVYSQYLIKEQLSATTKRFILDTERPDGEHAAELSLNVSFENNQLTIGITSNPAGGSISFQVQKIYAR